MQHYKPNLPFARYIIIGSVYYMKYILPILFLLFSGCSEDEDLIHRIDHEIIGKWQLEATKISPGGIVDWSDVSNGEIYDFKPDGTLELSKLEECKAPVAGTFTVFEDQLFITYSCNSQLYEPSYHFRLEDGKLILGFIGCIEECSYRYKPVN